MIAVWAMSPLEGFMCKADYDNVVDNMRLSNGLPWSIPIILSATKEEIEEATKKLSEVLQSVGASMYQQGQGDTETKKETEDKKEDKGGKVEEGEVVE